MVNPQIVRIQYDFSNLGGLLGYMEEYDLDEILAEMRVKQAHILVVNDPAEFAAIVEILPDRIHAREMDGKIKDYHNFIDFYCFMLANQTGKNILSVSVPEHKKPNRRLVERLGYKLDSNNEFYKMVQ